MSLIKRLIGNLGASTIQTGLIAAYQIVSVPVLIGNWGVNLYGEWLLLLSLTAYFQMTDLGMNIVTANSVSILFVQGRIRECRVLLTSVTFFLLFAFGCLFLLTVALIKLNTFSLVFFFSRLSTSEVNLSILFLLGQVGVGTLSNLLSSTYRAAGKFARGVMVDNAVRTGEYAAIIIGASIDFGVTTILLTGLIVKLLGLAFKYFDSLQYLYFMPNAGDFSLGELKKMLRPAVAFLSLPVADAFALQGPILILNMLLGNVAVVLFSTSRAFVNFGRAVIGIFQRSVWPEISLAFGRRDLHTIRRLHRISLSAAFAVILLTSVGIVLGGRFVYTAWTAGEISYDSHLIYLLLVQLAISSLWGASAITLQATGKHERYSLLLLAVSVAIVPVTFLLIKLTSNLVLLPLASIFVIDIYVGIYVLRSTFRLTEDNLAQLIHSIPSSLQKLGNLVSKQMR